LPDQPSFSELYWMLSDAGDGYRELVRRALEGEPRSAFQRSYWGPGGEFEALRRENRRALVEQLEAPLNKIRRLVSTAEIQMLLEHPRLVSIAELIDRGEVLIVNGAKDAIGDDNAQLVFLLVLQLVHRALQGRQRLPAGRRRPVAVHVDEAHNVMSRSLATMAAEGRSAGLQLGVAYQYSAQIQDELVKSGVRSLYQSVVAFRLRELEDARALSGLAMEIYQDVIQAHEELQERLRFSADDLVRLPEFHALCMLVADGAPRPAFIAETLPMERLADPARACHHRAAQLERGCAPLAAPPDLRPPTEDELDEFDELGRPADSDGNGHAGRPGVDERAVPALAAETVGRDELERERARREGGDDL
jgi:hypothetical protein